MTAEVLALVPGEDYQLVDVDAALILETVLDLREVDWDDDQHERAEP